MSVVSRTWDTYTCRVAFTEPSDRVPRIDEAFASPAVWKDLLRSIQGSSTGPVSNKLAISLDFSKSNPANLVDYDLLSKRTTFWVTLAREGAQEGLILPHIYSRSFHDSTGISCSVTVVNPVEMNEVVLLALSQSAFQLAKQRPQEVEQWLCRDNRLLRLGAKHSCRVLDGLLDDSVDASYDSPYTFEVAMLEPVMQGIGKPGHTRFLVTCAPEAGPLPNGTRHSHRTTASQHCEISSAVDDDVSIDEYFLAGSTLSSLSFSHGRSFPNGTASDVSRSGSITPTTTNSISKPPDGIVVPLQPLTRPLFSSHSSSSVVYLRTSALAHMGVFDGDWAIAEGSYRRLVQVHAADHLLNSCNGCASSPSLLRNLVGSYSLHPELRLWASPFGAGPPAIPTAKTVTIARIASPASVERAHQKTFLRALKHHFAEEKRMVKRGDIVAVAISTRASVFDPPVATEESKDDQVIIEDVNDDQLSPPDAAVFFVVTNLEYNVLTQQDDRTLSDSLVQCAMGELGCWIDPSVTRMVQTGVEHSLVPDMSSYLGLDVWDDYRVADSSEFPARKKLHDFINASLQEHAVEFGLLQAVLLSGPPGSGLKELAYAVASSIGFHSYGVNAYDSIAETDSKTASNVKDQFALASSCSPCIFVLENLDAFAQTTQGGESNKAPVIVQVLAECIDCLSQAWKDTGHPVFLVATTGDVDKVPPSISALFKQQIICGVPDEKRRRNILVSALSRDLLGADVSLKNLAVQTAALTDKDILDLVYRTRHCAVSRAMKSLEGSNNEELDILSAGLVLTKTDFDAGLEKTRASFSQNIGAPTIPNVTWDDVGGLASVKEEILDTIQLPLEHPELFGEGLKRRSGILLYGPPGTGKTLLAKAVATSCSLNFFSVKGPELLNMYIGESEANVRRVFQRARDANPCVIFFDELDSVAPKRGNQGDSGGVMDRIVSQLLAELDGMSTAGSGSSVFVIGATNRPDLLDPALLRPGRFDRMLYLGISDTHEAQFKILEALTRKFRLDPGLNLRDVAERCLFNYTGADFYALCSDSMLKAMTRKAEEVDAKIEKLNTMPPLPGHQYPLTPQYYLTELAEASDTDVLVSYDDFDAALRELVPSVSQSELDHYREVQQKFSSIDSSAKGKGKERAS